MIQNQFNLTYWYWILFPFGKAKERKAWDRMNINSDTNHYAVQNQTNYVKNAVRAADSSKTKATVKASVKNTSVDDYVRQTAQNDLSAKGETTFPFSSPVQRLAKYTKVIYEHYAKENKENKKFANPSMHINDKYFNKDSPYYIKGLSPREREICAESERRVLNGGQPEVNSYDPVIQKTFGGGIMSEAAWNEEVRAGINDSVNRLFEENGIVIPENTDLRLRVDPYEYKIHAGGVDESLAKQIEEVLNKGKNGKYLYDHLLWCNPANNGSEPPEQYLMDLAVREKAMMWHLVDDLTGYDIRELENRDGSIYTPDGRNLWNVMKENYDKKAAKGETGGLSLQTFYKDYQMYAEEGWDKEDERGLTIGYQNGILYDIDTEYGYAPGQNKWLLEEKEKERQFWEAYQREKEKSIQNGEADPSSSQPSLFKAEPASAGLRDSILNKYTNSNELVSPPADEYTAYLNALLHDGRATLLTDTVISLPRNGGQGFDVKA